jgi:hypothetical protein
VLAFAYKDWTVAPPPPAICRAEVRRFIGAGEQGEERKRKETDTKRAPDGRATT